MQDYCTILGLPLQAGTGRGGCLMGPDAFRTAGLAEVITDQGFKFIDLGNLSCPTHIPNISGPAHLKKLPEIVAWTLDIQRQASKLVTENNFPIFIERNLLVETTQWQLALSQVWLRLLY